MSNMPVKIRWFVSLMVAGIFAVLVWWISKKTIRIIEKPEIELTYELMQDGQLWFAPHRFPIFTEFDTLRLDLIATNESTNSVVVPLQNSIDTEHSDGFTIGFYRAPETFVLKSIRIAGFAGELCIHGKELKHFVVPINPSSAEKPVVDIENDRMAYKVAKDTILTSTVNLVKDYRALINLHLLLFCIAVGFFLFIIVYRSQIPNRIAQLGKTSSVTFVLTYSLLTSFLIFGDRSISTTEKRKLNPMPSLLETFVWDYPKKYESFFNDHFPFREQLSYIDNIIQFVIFRTSPKPNKVILGKGNWLYYNIRENNSTRSIKPFTAEELEIIRDHLQEMKEWCALHGIEFAFMPVPAKHTMYPENLPDYLQHTWNLSQLDQLCNYLSSNSDLLVINVKDTLIDEKKKNLLYYETDTHWNQLGGFIAYQKLMNVLKEKYFPNLERLDLSHYNMEWLVDGKGDLTQMINAEDLTERNIVIMSPKSASRAFLVKQRSNMSDSSFLNKPIVKATSDTTLPELFLYRDSFASYLIPHLSESFSRSSFYWSRVFYPEPVLREKPDVVIFELYELFLYVLLDDNPQYITDELARRPASLPTDSLHNSTP